MQKSLVMFFFVLPLIVLGCAKPSEEEKLLLTRANEFYESVSGSDFGQVWDMATASMRSDLDREEYTFFMKSFFGRADVKYKLRDAAVVEKGRIGKSRAFVTIDFGGGDKEAFCEGHLWRWENGNWYVERGYECEREKEAIDKEQQQKRL